MKQFIIDYHSNMIIIVISGSSDRHRIPVLSVTADAYDNGTYLIGLLGELNKLLVPGASAWPS